MTRWYALLLFGLVAFAPSAWAEFGAQGGDIGSPEAPFKTYVCKSDADEACNGVAQFTVGTSIKGFKLVAGSANSYCSLYDATSVPSNGVTGLIDELSEATADEVAMHIWPSPIELRNGLSILVGGSGTSLSECIIYY